MSPRERGQHGRLRDILATVVVATVVVAGAALVPNVVTSGGGGSGFANLFVDDDGGTCTRSADPIAYDSLTACSSLQLAYAAAVLGDTVRVASGSYSAQTMNYVADKADTTNTSDVTFIAESGATVSGITAYGLRHVTLDGFDFGGSSVIFECEDSSPAPVVSRGHHPVDITVQNSTMSFTRSENASMLTIQDNEIGPSSSVIKVGASADTGGGNCTDNAPSNITFQDNDIHDFRESAAASHMECIFVEGVQGLVIRRNIIRGCSVFDIFFKEQLSAGLFGMSDITIENNMLGHPVASAFRSAGDTAISFSGGASTVYSNLTVRNNAANAKILLRDDLGVTYTSTTIAGNLALTRGGSCSAATWTNNAYLNSGVKCAGDVADGVASGWVDVESQAEIDSSTSDPTIDYHLSAGAWAIGQGTAGTSSSTDYDEENRPVGGTYDIGADER